VLQQKYAVKKAKEIAAAAIAAALEAEEIAAFRRSITATKEREIARAIRAREIAAAQAQASSFRALQDALQRQLSMNFPLSFHHFHIYHWDHTDNDGRPIYSFASLSSLGVDSRYAVETDWHRYKWPDGLTMDVFAEFSGHVFYAFRTTCPDAFAGVYGPAIVPFQLRQEKFLDVSLQNINTTPASKSPWNLDQIKVHYKGKDHILNSHSEGKGIERHFARIDIKQLITINSGRNKQDAKAAAINAVECLGDILVQAVVVDAWMAGHSLDIAQGDAQEDCTMWSGDVTCLIMLFDDVKCTKKTNNTREILEMQYGFLKVGNIEAKLFYPYRLFWCTNCKTNIGAFHDIRNCPKRHCNVCGLDGLHFTNKCPETARLNATCKKCRKKGHFTKQCPRLAICETCKATGHFTKDCLVLITCEGCKTPGHAVENCSEKEKVQESCGL
jgi:hypothetical protein